MTTDEKCYKFLDCHTDYIRDAIYDICSTGGCITTEYINSITDELMGDIVDDIIDTADISTWNDDDVKLAFSRSLCKKMNIRV